MCLQGTDAGDKVAAMLPLLMFAAQVLRSSLNSSLMGLGLGDWISTPVSFFVCSEYLAPLLIPSCQLGRHQVEGRHVRTWREQLTLQSQEFKQSLLWLLAAGQQGHMGYADLIQPLVLLLEI